VTGWRRLLHRRTAPGALTWRSLTGRILGAAGRLRAGRPVRLTARVLAAGAVAAAAVTAAGHDPAGPALATGAATWLVLTARRELAAPGDRPRTVPGERRGRNQPGSGPVATGLAGSADQADHDPT
jgi:hypothetical protein